MDMGKGSRLSGRKILLGVTGGIGAYKTAELARAFVREGADVSVVMTRNATQFITPLTMEALTRNPVGLDMFSLTEERAIRHIDRAQSADVFIVAPATANYLGKATLGIADDLLTTVTLAVRCPVIIAPAMNSASRSSISSRPRAPTVKLDCANTPAATSIWSSAPASCSATTWIKSPTSSHMCSSRASTFRKDGRSLSFIF